MVCPHGEFTPCRECLHSQPFYVPLAQRTVHVPLGERSKVGFRSHSYLEPSCEFVGWNEGPAKPHSDVSPEPDYVVKRLDHLQAEIRYLTNKINEHIDKSKRHSRGKY